MVLVNSSRASEGEAFFNPSFTVRHRVDTSRCLLTDPLSMQSVSWAEEWAKSQLSAWFCSTYQRICFRMDFTRLPEMPPDDSFSRALRSGSFCRVSVTS